jgi:hypothetical protein
MTLPHQEVGQLIDSFRRLRSLGQVEHFSQVQIARPIGLARQEGR